MSFWIALRYFFSKQNLSLVNVISIITLVSVIFITASMFLVLAIFNGFASFHHDIYETCNPDLRIEHVESPTFKSDNILAHLTSFNKDSVIDFSEVLEREIIIQYRDKDPYSGSRIDKNSYAVIKGVDMNYKKIYPAFQSEINALPEAIQVESDSREYGFNAFLNYSDLIIIGQDLASRIDLKVYNDYSYNQNLRIWYLTTNNNRPELFYEDKFKTAAIFKFGEKSIDNIIISDIEELQKVFSFFECSYIDLNVKNENINIVQEKIQNALGDEFIVKNRMQQSPFIFKIIQAEKLVVYFIFILIIIITMITLIGAILILINQKKQDIIIFYSLGYSASFLSSIFSYLGFLIVFSGFVVGIILGVIFCLLQQSIGFVKLNTPFGVLPYPIEFNISDIMIISILILLIGFLISIIVSRIIFFKKIIL